MHRSGRLLALLAGMLISTAAFAASGSVALEPAGNDPANIASLQRGARNVINYCSGCHSAKYVRFNSIARDLQLEEDMIVTNLMFNAGKIHETILATMREEDAARWFGQAPPDLSLIARARGTDYVFNFLRNFYLDPESPTGVDNTVLAGTSMPNVLWELQGFQQAVFHEDENRELVFDKFEQVTPGSMTGEEFDAFLRDSVNFLEYISEPVRSTRRILGVWVLMYLTVFWIVASMLKKQIWKDVT